MIHVVALKAAGLSKLLIKFIKRRACYFGQSKKGRIILQEIKQKRKTIQAKHLLHDPFLNVFGIFHCVTLGLSPGSPQLWDWPWVSPTPERHILLLQRLFTADFRVSPPQISTPPTFCFFQKIAFNKLQLPCLPSCIFHSDTDFCLATVKYLTLGKYLV